MGSLRETALHSHNLELLKCIQELQEKQRMLQKEIKEEETERQDVRKDMQVLTKRLAHINESLDRKNAARAEVDRVIQEIESAYEKILQSSQTLLTIAKKECSSLSSKQQVAQPA